MEATTTKMFKATIAKVDPGLGMVFGYAIVCEEGGVPYFDNDKDGFDEHITPDAMLDAAVGFAKSARVAKENHTGDQIGINLFLFPMTTEIAKALDITVQRTGLLIGMRPDQPEVLAKFADGTYTGFSIGGSRLEIEDVDE